MRFLRQVIGDPSSGGVLAALLAVMMLLQGAIGGYGQAAMAAFEPGVLCTSEGVDHGAQKAPGGSAAQKCCLAACQAASPALAAALSANILVSDVRSFIGTGGHPSIEVDARPPRDTGKIRDTRGPPGAFA